MKELIPLLVAESALLILVLIVLPICALCLAKKSESNGGMQNLKGLALPQGSVRSMLALMIVGSFVIFLVFGGHMATDKGKFSEIVAALTGIAGTVVGFYFGSGGSGKKSE